MALADKLFPGETCNKNGRRKYYAQPLSRLYFALGIKNPGPVATASRKRRSAGDALQLVPKDFSVPPSLSACMPRAREGMLGPGF